MGLLGRKLLNPTTKITLAFVPGLWFIRHVTFDAQRLNSPAENHRVAHGSASIEGHTPIALKGGPLSRPGYKVLGPMEHEHLGVKFLLQACKDGFFSFVSFPSGPVYVHNPVTNKPWSKYRSCLRWTRKVIKSRGRLKAGVTPI